jgi:hypothetical protein
MIDVVHVTKLVDYLEVILILRTLNQLEVLELMWNLKLWLN